MSEQTELDRAIEELERATDAVRDAALGIRLVALERKGERRHPYWDVTAAELRGEPAPPTAAEAEARADVERIGSSFDFERKLEREREGNQVRLLLMEGAAKAFRERAEKAEQHNRALVEARADVSEQAEAAAEDLSAAEDAFDAIAEICGCSEWDYPGQLVRDVKALAEHNRALAEACEAVAGYLLTRSDAWAAELLKKINAALAGRK